ncbi:MAG: tRNA pseudouridine(13) synthase TruD [Gammaproteobacteria bacterium]|nr:tRNA pseudouridine(13) synthase TruD [Gammaproteobacteria bacterium]MBQ0840803.1 tRNA pseudouridine(13) synthase TruD [Gammaproteobacteria bacterium]
MTQAKPVFSLNFSHAYKVLAGCADLKTEPEDFVVVEEFDEANFSGSGEHVCLQIRKRGQNTRWIAAALAEVATVAERDIGFCGMKDRRAVTTQWFSVAHAGEWKMPALAIPDCEVLQVIRHQRKLRRGSHRGNHFVIRLRNVSSSIDRPRVDERLSLIAKGGVPNYFGEQRFGIEGQNLVEADRLLRRGRQRKMGGRQGIFLSAARSYLFNRVLSERVTRQSWSQALDGESTPQGPLWGRGRSLSRGALAELESRVLADFQPWCHALEHLGLDQQQRDLVLLPSRLEWHWQDRDLCLSFALPVGTYATSVLRELLDVNTPPYGES